MKRVQDFFRFAEDCREFATMGLTKHRHQLLQMAETWERLAHERLQEIESSDKPKADDPTKH